MNQLLAAGNGDSSGGLHFPAIESLLEWPGFLFEGNTFFELNKVGLIYIWAMVAPLVIFILAIRKSALVPRGVQTVAESSVDFVRENIVMQTMGPDGMRFMPFLLSLFFFIFFANITEVIPFIQLPANARMAAPAFLAILVWVVFNAVGIKSQGFFSYFKNTVIPPGVPGALLPLVAVLSLFQPSWCAPSHLQFGFSPTCSPGTFCWLRSQYYARICGPRTFWFRSYGPHSLC